MSDDKVDILIVDDQPDKALSYRTILDELGENVVVARSGAEALAQVLRREFAVILLDVYMPGMDGLETAALIRGRKKSRHTPIIFVTGFSDEVRVAQGYAHGAVDYILAPVIPEVLQAKIKVFVDLFRMTRQVKRQAEERVALVEERSRRAAVEEANRRLALLARAGAILGRSLDFNRTAEDAARIPVPAMADSAALVLESPAAGTPHAIVASAFSGEVSVEKTDRLPPVMDALVSQAFTEGVATHYPKLDDKSEPAPRIYALPLVAAGRTVAVLALARAEDALPFNLADMAAADALASRAASALENARLYQEIQLADRQKNEFLSMLAHELRNPLAPIRNAAAILRHFTADAAKLEWAAGVIDRQVAHMVRLVDDLLDISRINRGKIRLQRQTVDIANIIAQAVEASRPEIEGRGHFLQVAQLPSVNVDGDPARLAQVVTNLLNNAAKYTEPGGRITVAVEAACPSRPGSQVTIRVRDTGIGIPTEMLTTVFDLFTQVDNSLARSEGGLGIGLTLVRRIVELHGGSVEATSEGLGFGSEFIIRLPQALSAPPSVESIEPIPSHEEVGVASGHLGSSTRVLVVDDNIDGADSLAQLLRMDGHAVRLAHDGPAALAAAAEFRPEATVLDIGLPGMDGFEVARRLRDQYLRPGALLIAVTGYGRDEDRKLAQDAGFDFHFVKPVDVHALRNLLSSQSTNHANAKELVARS